MAASEQELREARRWVAVCLLGALALLGVGIRFAPWTPPPRHTQAPTPFPLAKDFSHPNPEADPEEPETPSNPSLPLWPFFVPKNSH